MKKIMKNKRAQEEMIGFAIIMVIVAVILLVFLSISLRKSQKNAVESYEVEGFIQSLLQYTTSCEKTYSNNFLNVRDAIFSCNNGEDCLNGESVCENLELTLSEIVFENWKVGVESPVKGYLLNITSEEGTIISLSEGEITNNYKGSSQNYQKSGENIGIKFSAYYE
jgi:hypothetical protein